jgi:hypothetical protein
MHHWERSISPRPSARTPRREKGLLSPALSSTSAWRRGRIVGCLLENSGGFVAQVVDFQCNKSVETLDLTPAISSRRGRMVACLLENSDRGQCIIGNARSRPGPPHEPPSRKGPPLPGPLLHKCVEEREMARRMRVHGFNARICSGNSPLKERVRVRSSLIFNCIVTAKPYPCSWQRDRLGRSGWRPASQPDVTDDSPFGEYSYGAEVFGETPKTAVETTALPKCNCMVTA